MEVFPWINIHSPGLSSVTSCPDVSCFGWGSGKTTSDAKQDASPACCNDKDFVPFVPLRPTVEALAAEATVCPARCEASPFHKQQQGIVELCSLDRERLHQALPKHIRCPNVNNLCFPGLESPSYR